MAKSRYIMLSGALTQTATQGALGLDMFLSSLGLPLWSSHGVTFINVTFNWKPARAFQAPEEKPGFQTPWAGHLEVQSTVSNILMNICFWHTKSTSCGIMDTICFSKFEVLLFSNIESEDWIQFTLIRTTIDTCFTLGISWCLTLLFSDEPIPSVQDCNQSPIPMNPWGKKGEVGSSGGDGVQSEWNPRQGLLSISCHSLTLRSKVLELRPGLRHEDSRVCRPWGLLCTHHAVHSAHRG